MGSKGHDNTDGAWGWLDNEYGIDDFGYDDVDDIIDDIKNDPKINDNMRAFLNSNYPSVTGPIADAKEYQRKLKDIDTDTGLDIIKDAGDLKPVFGVTLKARAKELYQESLKKETKTLEDLSQLSKEAEQLAAPDEIEIKESIDEQRKKITNSINDIVGRITRSGSKSQLAKIKIPEILSPEDISKIEKVKKINILRLEEKPTTMFRERLKLASNNEEISSIVNQAREKFGSGKNLESVEAAARIKRDML